MADWSDKQTATLRRMRAAGCTDEEIALALRVTPKAVNGKRWRLGLVAWRYGGKGGPAPRGDPLALALLRAERERQGRTPTKESH
jgi:hypothetical protein